MTSFAIGIDIGGTKTSAGVVDEVGLVADSLLVEPTPATDGPEAILRLLVRMVRELDEFGDSRIALGVGTAGVVSADGVIRSATNAIARWPGFELRRSLSEAVGRPVVVLNDVHAAAFGEAAVGAGRGVDAFLMVTVGTGVGGAVSRGGLPDVGATGIAGSLGHTAARGRGSEICTCGQAGHIEAYASGPAMECAFAEATGRKLGLREIVELAHTLNSSSADGPLDIEAAREVLQAGAHVLGTGLADALNLIDVGLVILGGGVASVPGYLDLVSDAFVTAALPGPSSATISAAQLGSEATLVGAGLFAMRRGAKS